MVWASLRHLSSLTVAKQKKTFFPPKAKKVPSINHKPCQNCKLSPGKHWGIFPFVPGVMVGRRKDGNNRHHDSPAIHSIFTGITTFWLMTTITLACGAPRHQAVHATSSKQVSKHSQA